MSHGIVAPVGRARAREGVASLWIVDPAARTLEAYRLESGRWVVAATC